MIKKLENIILGFILVTGLFLYIYFRNNSHYQRNIIYLTGGSYFLWSLYHHYQKGDLHLSIIIEYLIIILFALVVISSTFL
ncbi:hypothetical protein HYV64_02195 [Candidatus Shapirobacteria bacterium]|nr:hypothetical protein [Candidatus Shapirobacteria bacterium]